MLFIAKLERRVWRLDSRLLSSAFSRTVDCIRFGSVPRVGSGLRACCTGRPVMVERSSVASGRLQFAEAPRPRGEERSARWRE